MAKAKTPPVPAEMLPKHIAFIMDGNGRWAKKRGLPRTAGHVEGAKNFKKIVRYCKDIGIENITFYAFSTENWKRPDEEVSAIMNLMREYLVEVRKHITENTRFIVLGDKSAFSPDLKRGFDSIEADTVDFNDMTLNMAVNYGSRHEITGAVRELARQVQAGTLSPEDITEETISQALYTKDLPDVDLMIRPSGEFRISNFLLWQSAYAELYFCDTLWPDFSPKDLDEALIAYAKRNRRFGGV
ncbi:MAG: isoprenyl transferase [Oscillospiraceae bacterium]|nr:isoprenyl transferase [Ruminococcus sp.]MBQ4346402.1 isoprenyl transferase [Oscillospiraceae bacterium]